VQRAAVAGPPEHPRDNQRGGDHITVSISETSPSGPTQPGEQRRGDVPVSMSDVSKSFDDLQVIRDLDLEVEPGSIIGLIGPSGCGKTTTVRLMTGLLWPSSGEVHVFGTPAHELSSRQRSRIGYLPQIPALFPELSLRENLNFHASMYGLPLRRKRRIDELLDWVELSEHRSTRVSDASGGMQRRVALAAAFVQDPVLAFLDEPTAGIDPILRAKFWERFRAIAEAGKTLVVTTQYVGEASECDLVALLSDGELVLFGTPDQLRWAAYEGEVVDVTLNGEPTDGQVAQLADTDFVVGAIERLEHHQLRIVVDDADRAVRDLTGALRAIGLEANEMWEHDVDYDEAFMKVVQRHRDRREISMAADSPTSVA
jgi:ABC-2 type transport system ATP-binding protein